MKKQKYLRIFLFISGFILINSSQALIFGCTQDYDNYYTVELSFKKNIQSKVSYLDNVSLTHYQKGTKELLDTHGMAEIDYWPPNKGGYLNLKSINSLESERSKKWFLIFDKDVQKYSLHIKLDKTDTMLQHIAYCLIDNDADADGYGVSFNNKKDLLDMIENTKNNNSNGKYQISIFNPSK